MERAIASAPTDIAFLLMPALWFAFLVARFFVTAKMKLNASPMKLRVKCGDNCPEVAIKRIRAGKAAISFVS
jgi:hypothetical protein